MVLSTVENVIDSLINITILSLFRPIGYISSRPENLKTIYCAFACLLLTDKSLIQMIGILIYHR